jgi:hypothetical protein
MSVRTWLTPALVVAALGAAAALRPRVVDPVVTAASEQGAGTTTLDDQTDLAVTVYNSDIALVPTRGTSRSAAVRPTCTSWTSRRR